MSETGATNNVDPKTGVVNESQAQPPVADPVQPAAAADAPAEGSKEAPLKTSTLLDESKADEAPKEPAKPLDLKVPEDMELNAEQLEQFKALATEHNLPPEKAQELLDLHTGALKEAAESSAKLWLRLQDEWKEEVQKDPEIGGANFASSKATVAKVLERYGTPKLMDALALTGAGNNPEVFRFLHNVGKVLNEGTHVPAGGPASQARVLGQGMWPDLPTG